MARRPCRRNRQRIRVDRVLRGKVSATGGRACTYVIQFSSKTPVPDEDFETADYDVDWDCRHGEQRVRFRSFMFITEAPYALSREPVYQINVDVRDLFEDLDESLTAIVLFDAGAAKVGLDGLNPPEYLTDKGEHTRPAKDVAEALEGAVNLAVGAWNDKVWEALARPRN